MKRVLIGLGCLTIAAVSLGGPHLDRDVYTATVKEKKVEKCECSGGEGKYMISTELSDGTKKVFENTDSWIESKSNSSDLYDKLEIGKTYELKTYGWRIPFLSLYENILDVEPVD